MATLINNWISENYDSAPNLVGFDWDRNQGIFYSRTDAWQRNFGYFALYDEAAPFAACLIHCEPIKFRYGGKNWNIELWKGQYGICVGAEVGIYTGSFNVNNQNIDRYLTRLSPQGDTQCAAGDDCLRMSFRLKNKRSGDVIFRRNSDLPRTTNIEKHWWLTGFKPGINVAPSDLINEIKIFFKDADMVEAFVGGLVRVGYSRTNIQINSAENSVEFTFDTPLTTQPSSSWVLNNYEIVHSKIIEFLRSVFVINNHTIVEIGQFIHAYYGFDKKNIAKILRNLGFGIREIGEFLKNSLNASAREVGEALRFAGYKFASVVKFIVDNFNLNKVELAKTLKAIGYSIRTIAKYLKEKMDIGYIELVDIFKSAEFSISSIIAVIASLFGISDSIVRRLL